MSLLRRLVHASIARLITFACAFGLAGLAIVTVPVFSPRALPVVLSMSLGQAFGVAAFGCYALAVVIDARRAKSETGPQSTRNRAP